jgi:O-antigen ligase
VGVPSVVGRVSGSLPHANDLALIPILLPFAIAMLVDRSRKVQAVAAIAIPIALGAAALTQSRNAWLGLLVGSAFLALFSRHRRVTAMVAAAGAAIFLLAVALDIGNVKGRLEMLLQWEQDGRFSIWLVALKMFEASPVLGTGAHTFAEQYASYIADVELPARFGLDDKNMPWAHNLYLEFLSERGLLGLGAFLVVVVAVVGSLGRAIRTSGRALSTYPAYLLASFAVFLTMSLFDLTFLKDWVALIFWLFAGVAAQVGTRGPAAVPVSD